MGLECFIVLWAAGMVGLFLGTRAGEKEIAAAVEGFSGGLLVAMASLNILPIAFSGLQYYAPMFGMVLGVTLGIIAEAKESFRFYRTLGLLVFGIIYGILFAIGNKGVPLFLLTALLSCIPWGREIKGIKMVLLSGFIGISGLLGMQISNLYFVNIVISFLGGYLLYISCGRIVPQYPNTMKNIIVGGCAFFGFLCGIGLLFWLGAFLQ